MEEVVQNVHYSLCIVIELWEHTSELHFTEIPKLEESAQFEQN